MDMIQNESFSQKESRCESAFSSLAPYWHITNNGKEVGVIFSCKEDYEFGMNAVAMIASVFPDITIVTFELMSDHVHLIVSGSRERAVRFFEAFRKKLSNYFTRRGRPIDCNKFKCNQPIGITDLKMIRYEIAYVNRNGFAAVQSETPFSYRWGAGYLYFNWLRRIKYGCGLSEMTYRDKRTVFKTSEDTLPGEWRIYENVILPDSYCNIEFGESLFRDGNQYFSILSKSFEAYSEIAKRLSDRVFLTDNELYPAAVWESKKLFGRDKLNLLAPGEKIEMARIIHSKYNASNEQVRRLLNLDRAIVNELFPMTSRQ